MNVTIVDYKSGNISSVINSFKEVAQNKVKIEVTSDLNKIKLSDKKNNFNFELKNRRNLDRKTLNLLRNKEISAIIS